MPLPVSEISRLRPAESLKELGDIIAGLRNERDTLLMTVQTRTGRSPEDALRIVRELLDESGLKQSGEPVLLKVSDDA